MLKIKRILIISTALVMLFAMTACEDEPIPPSSSSSETILIVPSSSVDPFASIPSTEGPSSERKSWEELNKQNPDISGWMQIPNTQVNYPVTHYKDNDYYLHRDIEGNDSARGTLFADTRNNLTSSPISQNITVYGHNQRDGSMFGNLMKYKEIEFAKANPIINFDTESENGKWKIFSCFITNADPKDGEIFEYRNPDFTTQEEFLTFIDGTKDRSLYDFGDVDIQENDRVITLSTCSYEVANARFVVMARKVRHGEDATVDTSKTVPNPDILWFDGYPG